MTSHEMKSIIIRVLLTIAISAACLSIALLSSCSALVEIIAEPILDEIFIDYPYIEEPLNDVWLRSSSFRYQAESGNYWKSPREMDADRVGDCEDFAGWMIYHLGNKARLVRIHRNSDAPELFHAVVEYDGMMIEPQIYGVTYNESEYTVSASMSYDAVMKLSTAMFTK